MRGVFIFTVSSLVAERTLVSVLFLANVDDEVVVAVMLADDHALVHFRTRLDEQDAAILDGHHAVDGRCAGFVGDQHAGMASADRSWTYGP